MSSTGTVTVPPAVTTSNAGIIFPFRSSPDPACWDARFTSMRLDTVACRHDPAISLTFHICSKQSSGQRSPKPQPRPESVTLLVNHSSLVKGANRAHSGALIVGFLGRRSWLFEFEYRFDDETVLDKPDLICWRRDAMDSHRSRNVPQSGSKDSLPFKGKELNSRAPGEVTGLLVRWREGDRTALEQLIPLVHDELRRLARRSLRGENEGNALQTAELINEAYLKLVNCSRVQWHDRTHFFAIASTLMRRILVDEARKRQFQKRGGEFTRISFDDAMTVAPERTSELIALDEALYRLAEHSARKSRVVELRYFGGLSIEETAAAMGVSIDVVKREWRTARLWLMKELTAPKAGSNGSRSVGKD